MKDIMVPKHRDDLTPAWLTAALREGEHLPANVAVTELEAKAIGLGRGFAGVTMRLRPRYDDVAPDVPHSFVVKLPPFIDAGPDQTALIRQMQAAEIQWYREMQAETHVRTPRHYWSGVDPGAGRYCLLLEDMGQLREATQMESCTLDDARVAVQALAGIHAGWWNSPELPAKSWLSGPREHAQLFTERFSLGWPLFVERFADEPWMPAFQPIGVRLNARLKELLERGAASASTIVHGDYRLENFMFGEAGTPEEFVVLDWQLCGRGSGLRDLAYFISQSLGPEARRQNEEALLKLYHKALADSGVKDYLFDQCYEDYRLGLLLSMWIPVNGANVPTPEPGLPPEQRARFDRWLGQALQLMRCLSERNALAILDNNAANY